MSGTRSMSGGEYDERSGLLSGAPPAHPAHDTDDADEQDSSISTPVCDESMRDDKPKEKPLPWRVVSTLYVLSCVAPIAFELIFPFVNQMILENGITNDPERVGFYSGLIESIFSFTSFLAVMPISYLSDHVGRKPVVLVGTLGLAVSTALFGTAKTYSSMILTRIIGGSSGGTYATLKVMLTESIEKYHQGVAFSGFIIAYRMGHLVGQPMGGLLAHPERCFKIFDTPFWRKYPFSLPCFVASAIAILGIIFAHFFTEETLPSMRKKKRLTGYGTFTQEESEISNTESPKMIRPSIRSVLTPHVVGAMISSSFLAFCSETIYALFPLFAFTPIESGGLGFSEAQIGSHLGFRSINNILVIFLYAPIERRIGSLRMLKLTSIFWPASIAFLPLLNAIARSGYEGTWILQATIAMFVTVWSFASLSWTASNIVLNNASPSAEALSVVNGVGQMAVTLPLAAAPAFITSIFAFSINHEEILGGNLIYAVQLFVSITGAIFTLFLKEPTHDWRNT